MSNLSHCLVIVPKSIPLHFLNCFSKDLKIYDFICGSARELDLPFNKVTLDLWISLGVENGKKLFVTTQVRVLTTRLRFIFMLFRSSHMLVGCPSLPFQGTKWLLSHSLRIKHFDCLLTLLPIMLTVSHRVSGILSLATRPSLSSVLLFPLSPTRISDLQGKLTPKLFMFLVLPSPRDWEVPPWKDCLRACLRGYQIVAARLAASLSLGKLLKMQILSPQPSETFRVGLIICVFTSFPGDSYLQPKDHHSTRYHGMEC